MDAGAPARPPAPAPADHSELLDRPRTRGDCELGPRPCPYVRCRHHLMTPPSRSIAPDAAYLDDLEVRILARLERGDETCALDVADRGDEVTLERIGEMLGPHPLGLERVRQIETRALEMLKRGLRRQRVDPLLAEDALAERDSKPANFLRRGGAGSKR